jgi:dihydrofolate reductase
MPLTIIVAMDAARGIGIQNRLPWHLPQDLAWFKRQTSGHPIIMGRKTYESIGRALPNRRNIVISRNPQWQAAGVETVPSIEAALALVEQPGQHSEHGETKPAFVIGGAQIYQAALPFTQRLLITEIAQKFDCDAFFPAIDPQIWQETARHPQPRAAFDYTFVEYQRKGE